MKNVKWLNRSSQNEYKNTSQNKLHTSQPFDLYSIEAYNNIVDQDNDSGKIVIIEVAAACAIRTLQSHIKSITKERDQLKHELQTTITKSEQTERILKENLDQMKHKSAQFLHDVEQYKNLRREYESLLNINKQLKMELENEKKRSKQKEKEYEQRLRHLEKKDHEYEDLKNEYESYRKLATEIIQELQKKITEDKQEVIEIEQSILELNEEYKNLLLKVKDTENEERLMIKKRLEEISDIIQDKSEQLIMLKKYSM